MTPKPTFTLFEISWEVAHRIGGVHTSISTKARALSERQDVAHVTIGPWMLSAGDANAVLEPDAAYDGFADVCRAAGLPVRVGRWRVPGRPLTVLVDFSALMPQKDEILTGLWQKSSVDSLFGGWDYVEPVLFGHAAGRVVELWWRHFLAGTTRAAVAQLHEWTSAAGVLFLREHAPWIGTVLTLHSTVLGAALSGASAETRDALADASAEQMAGALNVLAPQSLCTAAAREVDVLATVSDVTAEEAERFHGRAADAVMPNGIDPATLHAAGGDDTREDLRAHVADRLARVLGADVTDAALVVTGARYEFRNKGFDLLLDALGQMKSKPGRPIVVVLSVPAANAGLRRDVAARLASPEASTADVTGVIATHAVFDAANDPIARRCRELGLDNAPGSRVKVVHVAAYLDGDDGVFDLRYLEVVRAADLACFPSVYESWGYTPQESLALGVPTVTTDVAGYGRWATAQGLGADDGLHVLACREHTHAEARDQLAAILEATAAGTRPTEVATSACRTPDCGATWLDLLDAHVAAWRRASAAARTRTARDDVHVPRHRVPLPARDVGDGRRPRLFPLAVTPRLPAEIAGLRELAWNWRWTWVPAVRRLFAELSPTTWAACRGNPVRMLQETRQADLDERAGDADYAARVAAAVRDLHEYAAEASDASRPVAYFCAEFGIDACLPVYSGGLGVLAGDHIRAASDLALPFVGVGLLYRRGYFRQRLEGGVDQTERVDAVEPARQALTLVRDDRGEPVEVDVALPGGTLRLRAWRAQVGRAALYLLDADLPENQPGEREITAALYSGSSELRLRQEIVLGRGGVRLLDALGIRPAVFHVNEGHGAFVGVERVERLRAAGSLSFDEARELVRATTVFTTHTPVPAGHDRFDADLIRRHFSDAPERLGITWERFYALGSAPGDRGRFNMTALAVSLAHFVNGVSQLHGQVSRTLLQTLYPHLLSGDAPVESITNGVHLGCWTSAEIASLVGASGRSVTGEDFRVNAPDVSDQALWSVRCTLRQRLVDAVATRLRETADVRGATGRRLRDEVAGLDPNALTIGFARRFATYKRAGLLFDDADRLHALLSDPARPVRIVIAGKAHPRDAQAKAVIKRIGELAREPRFVGKILLLPDYEMTLARALVQGADVWLNTPRRPLEASGTSGMKAAANGGLNLSISDGWWPEAADGRNGWVIGDGLAREDDASADAADAASLMALLEDDVVRLFYERDKRGLPREWLARVRHALATIPHVFDTVRMVAEYRDRAYTPLSSWGERLERDDAAGARDLAARESRLRDGMASVSVVEAAVGHAGRISPGDTLDLGVDVRLGSLEADDLVVEMVVGRSPAADTLTRVATELRAVGPATDGVVRFEGRHDVTRVGDYDYGVRIRPRRAPNAELRVDDPIVWV